MLLGYIIMFVVGILLLVKGSDFFVDSGSEIGKTLKINEILLGVTIVSMGTSLPELIIAITSAQSDVTEIALGNILGTNIFNSCVILAVISLIRPVKFKKETVRRDMYMSVIAAIVLFIAMSDKIIDNASANVLSRADGLIFLVLFGMYMHYVLYAFTDYLRERKEKAKENELKLKLKDIDSLTKNICIMIGSIIMVFLGANWTVDAVSNIAVTLKISEIFISIIIIAIGTSLPEIFTSISAIKKGKQDIAIGNLIGSNMINTLFVLGTAAVINPIELPMDSLIIDAFTFLMVSILLLLHARGGKRYEFSKAEGFSLIAIYLAYITYVIARG